MSAWMLASPWLSFVLLLITIFVGGQLIAHIVTHIAVIVRGWKPQVCDECQMSLLDDDPHSH